MYVKITPIGSDQTPIFAGSDASSRLIGYLPKGAVFKAQNNGGGFTQLSLTSCAPAKPMGGSGMTGAVMAVPSVNMYTTTRRTRVAGIVRNGTKIDILDTECGNGMFEISCYTSNGPATGFVECRFIFRSKTKEDYDAEAALAEQLYQEELDAIEIAKLELEAEAYENSIGGGD